MNAQVGVCAEAAATEAAGTTEAAGNAGVYAGGEAPATVPLACAAEAPPAVAPAPEAPEVEADPNLNNVVAFVAKQVRVAAGHRTPLPCQMVHLSSSRTPTLLCAALQMINIFNGENSGAPVSEFWQHRDAFANVLYDPDEENSFDNPHLTIRRLDGVAITQEAWNASLKSVGALLMADFQALAPEEKARLKWKGDKLSSVMRFVGKAIDGKVRVGTQWHVGAEWKPKSFLAAYPGY